MPLFPLTAGLTIANSVVSDTFNEFIPFQPDRPGSSLEREYTNEHSAFIDVNGARIHYRDEGPTDTDAADTPTLLMLHGTYSSLHTWDGWADQLADEIRFIRLDMPGFGLTGPRRDGDHSLEVLIETVEAFCDELGLEDIAVGGNSLGGAVAWRFATDRPDIVSKLVLMDAGGATLLSNLSENYRALGTDVFPRYLTPRVVIRLALKDAYSDTAAVTPELVNRYHDLLLRSGNRRAVMEIASRYKEDHMEESSSEMLNTNTPVLPSSCDASPDVRDTYDICDIDVPTLFQWGEDDTWLPVEFGRELADCVDDNQFVVYEGVGHVPMEEAPERTAADAYRFLQQ